VHRCLQPRERNQQSPHSAERWCTTNQKRGRKRAQAGKVSTTVAADQVAVVLRTFAATVAPCRQHTMQEKDDAGTMRRQEAASLALDIASPADSPPAPSSRSVVYADIFWSSKSFLSLDMIHLFQYGPQLVREGTPNNGNIQTGDNFD